MCVHQWCACMRYICPMCEQIPGWGRPGVQPLPPPAALAISEGILIPECCVAGVGCPGHPQSMSPGSSAWTRPRFPQGPCWSGLWAPDGQGWQKQGHPWETVERKRFHANTIREQARQPTEHLTGENFLPWGHWVLRANRRPPVLPHGQACGSKMIQL